MDSARHSHLAHVPSFQDTPLVFFTVCTHGRRKILNSESVHRLLRDLWARSADRDGWFVGRYILMPDHVHFFARPSRNAMPMATWLKMWKSVSARGIAREHGGSGAVWQRDYFDRYLRSGENYGEKWSYVARNPVRAGLVVTPEDWPFQGEIYSLMF